MGVGVYWWVGVCRCVGMGVWGCVGGWIGMDVCVGFGVGGCGRGDCTSI